MNILIVGVNGSGKTYKAMDMLYNLCISKEKKYKHIYTNINGLNYDRCNELSNIEDYVKPFEFEDLEIHIQKEYDFFMSLKDKKSRKNIALKNQDDVIVETDVNIDYDDTCKNEGIYKDFLNSLIIIDECHLYFEDKIDNPKIRFLSYNRHFNIDTILITQSKSLIHKKYLSFVESMYIALSGAKRLWGSRFRYKQYASYQEYNSNMVGISSLSLDKNIASLYNSGSQTITSSALKKMLFPIFAGFVVLFLFYKFVIADRYHKNEAPPPTLTTEQPKEKSIVSDEKNIVATEDTDKPFFAVNCFKKSCNFKGLDYSFDDNVMFKFVNSFNCKIIIADNHVPLFTVYIMRCDKDLNKVLDLYKNTISKVQNETSIVDAPIISK